MTERSSNTSPTASAFWDRASSCWKTSQGSLALGLDGEEDWTLLDRLPNWGSTAGGALFEHPTPGLLIAVRDGSASPNGGGDRLPTPAVNDMGRGKSPEEWDAWTERMRERHGNGNGHGASLEIEAARLLPSPRAALGDNRNSEPWVRPLDKPQNLENAIGRVIEPDAERERRSSPPPDADSGRLQSVRPEPELAETPRTPESPPVGADEPGPAGCLRLLPTPTARDHKDTGDLKRTVPDDDSLLPRAIAHHVQ